MTAEKAPKKSQLHLSQEHLDVLNVIKEAEENYISSTEIMLRLRKESDYHRRLQQIISELVTIHNVPIGSSSKQERKGYFYCKTERDFKQAIHTLDTRVESVGNRRDALVRCYEMQFKE